MPSLHLQIKRSLSSLSASSPADAFLADKALTFLKHHPYLLNSLASDFTPEAASSLLLKSQNDQALILKFLKWAQPHPFFTPHCQCLALHILTRFKLYKSAQSLAESLALSMPHDEKGDFVFQCLKETYHVCDSSSSVIDLVVKSYSHLNFVHKALNIVNLAKFNGFMPGILSYNAILDSLIRCKKPIRFAEEVFGEMIRNGVSPNVFAFNILIRAFCAAGNLEMGLDAHCKLRKIDDAFKLFRAMASIGLQPSLISYNVIVNGLFREGRMEETSEVLLKMSRRGFAPDEVTYNILVNGYCQDGHLHQALVLHSEMLMNGLTPNVITYTSLINSMCKAGNMNRAMEFFDQMHVRGLRPNGRTYTTLIDGFSQQGHLNEAYRILNEMCRNGFSSSLVTYNTLIKGHCMLGRVEEALKVIQDMVGKGLAPDLVSYT